MDADRIIRGFYQDGAGNCASIGVIKAAMMAFGLDAIFRSLAPTPDGGLEAELQDKDEDGNAIRLSVTPDELTLARRSARFSGEDAALLDVANKAFAIMAKHAQVEGNDGGDPKDGEFSYADAIESLNDGEHFMEGPLWLGIKSRVRRAPKGLRRAKKFFRTVNAGAAQSPKHVLFVSRGVYDESGTPAGPRMSIKGGWYIPND